MKSCLSPLVGLLGMCCINMRPPDTTTVVSIVPIRLQLECDVRQGPAHVVRTGSIRRVPPSMTATSREHRAPCQARTNRRYLLTTSIAVGGCRTLVIGVAEMVQFEGIDRLPTARVRTAPLRGGSSRTSPPRSSASGTPHGAVVPRKRPLPEEGAFP